MKFLSRINTLLDKWRTNVKLKNIIFYSLLISMFLYTFSIPSFSGRAKYYIISYFFMALFAFFTVVYVFVYDKFNFKRRFLIPVLFVLEAFIGTALYSHDFRRWFSLVLMVITLFVYYFAFCAINKSRLSLKIIVFSFLVFSFYFMFVYRSEILHLRVTDRIGFYFDNPNAVGSYFSLAFATSTYVGLMFNKKRELFYLIPSGIFALCGVFTGSRTFIVLILVSVSAILFIRFKDKKWLFIIIYAILIVLFIIAINLPIFATLKLRTDQMIYTLFGVGNSKVDHSAVERVVWQSYGYYLGSRNLIFGLGCEGFSIFSGIGTYSHSNFSEVLCNFGLVGFALFYLCYILPFIYCFNSNKKDKYIVFVYFIYFLFKGFLGVSYYYKESYLIIALCLYLTNDARVLIKSRDAIEQEFCEVSI